MARIEEKIAEIADPALRQSIAEEVAKLKKHTRFGLVFEEHQPEVVPIYGKRIKRGERVAKKTGNLSEVWRVVSVKDGLAVCEQERGGETVAETRESFPTQQLVVIRSMGETIYPSLTPVDSVSNGDPAAPHHVLIEADSRSRLELFLMLQDEKSWKTLESVCGARCEALVKQHKAAIKKLTTAEQEDYNKVNEIAKDPEALSFLPPAEMMLAVDATDPEFRSYDEHLYVDATGHFVAKLNTWEHPVIEAEIARPDVVGWLRNVPRKPWALSLPYEYGGEDRPMYPDFLVVRTEGTGYAVDILEPHSPALADSYAKAKGLAQFAGDHQMDFGRIELIRLVGKEIKRLDLIDTTNRKRVLAVDSNAALDLIFGIANEQD